MSPRVDCEHLSEGQTQNLVAPSSDAVTGMEGMPTVCLCSERWHTHTWCIGTDFYIVSSIMYKSLKTKPKSQVIKVHSPEKHIYEYF